MFNARVITTKNINSNDTASGGEPHFVEVNEVKRDGDGYKVKKKTFETFEDAVEHAHELFKKTGVPFTVCD